jgi:hypothetical protein
MRREHPPIVLLHMIRTHTTSNDELRAAADAITELFAAQVAHGQQSKSLPAGQLACGQFLQNLANAQIGLHGTAAALRVLGPSTEAGHPALVSGLVAFVTGRLTEAVHPGQQTFEGRLKTDRNNVIKVSEVLWALKFVPAATAQTQDTVRELARRLQESMIEGKGWGYFLDSTSEAALPTAYATRALFVHGFSVDANLRHLEAAVTHPSADSDVFERIACLFVLTEANPKFVSERALRSALHRIWGQTEPLLGYPVEYNVEYTSTDLNDNLYVRIPWQLYLIAITRRLPPRRRYASRAIQDRLNQVTAAVATPEGFSYPHSGTRISARTNAVIYDVTAELAQRGQPPYLSPLLWLDQARLVAGSRPVRALITTTVIGLLSFTILHWVTSPAFSFVDVGPNLAASALLAVLALGRNRR